MAKKTLFEDSSPDGFRCRFDYEDHWCDVSAWEIIDNEVGQKYLHGFIKWDGCSEFRFSPDEEPGTLYGNFHWCGPEDYRKHFALLEYLYRRAQSLMASGNWQPWDKSSGP